MMFRLFCNSSDMLNFRRVKNINHVFICCWFPESGYIGNYACRHLPTHSRREYINSGAIT